MSSLSIATAAKLLPPLALRAKATYAGGAVKQPFINVEEKIDRFVGKRTQTPDALSLAGSRKADAIA